MQKRKDNGLRLNEPAAGNEGDASQRNQGEKQRAAPSRLSR